MKSVSFLATLLFAVLFLASCKKNDELKDITLYNPFEEGNGVELLVIDSIQKYSGAPNYVKAFFHINEEYFTGMNQVNKIIVYRNGIERARLSQGNDSTFIDIGLSVNGDYNFQLSALMTDQKITKKTSGYMITF